MTDKCLRSRSIAVVGDGQGNLRVTDVDDSRVTDSVQVTDQIDASDFVTVATAKDVGCANQQTTTSDVQIQSILESVRQIVQAEMSRQTELQTATLEARITAVSEGLNSKLNSMWENLKAEVRGESEKLAASLTEQFRTENEQLRQELSLGIQTEVQNRAKEIELLRKNTEIRLAEVGENISTVSAGIEERIAVHVCKTRKELERNTHEVDQRSKSLIREINEQKVRVDTAVEGIRQELGQTKEGLNKGIESLTNEVRTVTDTLQTERQRNLSEIQKVNLAVSRLEAKITGGLAAQNQSAVSVSNVPDNSCTENVNALSVVLPSGTTDLNDLSLPKFSNSSKQVVTHFLRELEEYFTLRKHPVSSNFRSALGPSRTLLLNSGSQQSTILSELMRTLKQRSQTYCGDKRGKPRYDVASTKTDGISEATKHMPNTTSVTLVCHQC